MAQRLRCPGGRPSVSYERIKCRYNIGYEIPIESNGVKTQTTNQTTLQPPRERKGVGSWVACSSNDQSRARGRKPRARMFGRRNKLTNPLVFPRRQQFSSMKMLTRMRLWNCQNSWISEVNSLAALPSRKVLPPPQPQHLRQVPSWL